MTTLAARASLSGARPRASRSLRRASSRSSRPGARGARLAARASSAGCFSRYGVREEQPDGSFLETYGISIDGNVGRETLRFAPGSVAVSLTIARPLGIVLEQVEGKGVVAVELVEGSNAAAAGARAGDVLRLTTAVAKGKSTVKVGKWQVEPSVDMRSRGANRAAYFACDGRSFDAVMDAVVSNGEEVDGVASPTVSLLLERPASA